MSRVAILGAGATGGAVARCLAARQRAGGIRLIDEQPGAAAGVALDIRQSGPIDGSDSRIEDATDPAAAAGAAAIVLADPAGGGDWPADRADALLRRLSRLGCFDAGVLVCAGAAHLPLVELCVGELGVARTRVLGSAPEAFASTARALVALEARISPGQVSLTVLGRPPAQGLIPWSDASAAGHSIAAVLNPPQLAAVETRLLGLWPPGPFTLGAAAALFCEAILCGSRRLLSAFVSLDRDNGTRAPVCAWPVGLGPSGLLRLGSPSLTPRDRTRLDQVLDRDAL